ncbi:MAG: substrate-binding domain-containing protein [Verrucomicrobiota bacterium]
MSRTRSSKVAAVKAKLLARLQDGFHRPGDRFLSAREVAGQQAVSYQTAHRIIAELRSEGWLERREASGTFVAGRAKRLRGVDLWFHPRAKRPGSFGAHLLALLKAALCEAGIACEVRWSGRRVAPGVGHYPVMWESPGVLASVRDARRYALLLNNRPPPGLGASLVDAVTTDDFSAGVAAAEVFLERQPHAQRYTVLGGPRDDERSTNRVNGFLSMLPLAKVFYTGSWYVDAVPSVAAKVLAAQPEGIFCVNDRLAQGILGYCREQGIETPPLIGHDNAPIAEELNLTTIETPWEEMVSATVEVVRRRLGGDSGPARTVFLAQRPVFRLTHRAMPVSDGTIQSKRRGF